ncbi:ficolin-1-like [Acanthaster planci]|uniref:Ficolin-1-like n=1 Tax=Acanthaster planci TaxID=133434 RepID=A0A8B7XMW6_ACAPL|nr:ficolin-1-like [Acanthaster planci]
MQVYCSMESGRGYIVLQRRVDGSISFHRNWQEYADGFGDLTREFWLGNEKLRTLTEPASESWELVVTLTSFDNQEARAHYGGFSITGATYDLDASDFDSGAGQAGDSLTALHLRSFTTSNQDNDNSGGLNCGQVFRSGWWFKKCNRVDSNLNGVYHSSPVVDDYQGIQWVSWKGRRYSLKGCEMKMRRNVVATQ